MWTPRRVRHRPLRERVRPRTGCLKPCTDSTPPVSPVTTTSHSVSTQGTSWRSPRGPSAGSGSAISSLSNVLRSVVRGIMLKCAWPWTSSSHCSNRSIPAATTLFSLRTRPAPGRSVSMTKKSCPCIFEAWRPLPSQRSTQTEPRRSLKDTVRTTRKHFSRQLEKLRTPHSEQPYNGLRVPDNAEAAQTDRDARQQRYPLEERSDQCVARRYGALDGDECGCSVFCIGENDLQNSQPVHSDNYAIGSIKWQCRIGSITWQSCHVMRKWTMCRPAPGVHRAGGLPGGIAAEMREYTLSVPGGRRGVLYSTPYRVA